MIPLNTQPISKPDIGDGQSLKLIDCWRTIQGEGPYAGYPAVFTRLYGCDLQCPSCDTDYTSNMKEWTVDEICAEIERLMPPSSNLVVLTGGEPLRQNVGPLIKVLRNKNFYTQIETNGTLPPPDGRMVELSINDPLYVTELAYATVVCSPKTGSVNDKLKPFITDLKYVVAHGKVDPEDGLPTDSLGAGVRVQRPWKGFTGTVYVQPLDEGDPERNKLHIQEAVSSCMKFGYVLSIQTHKIAGLP